VLLVPASADGVSRHASIARHRFATSDNSGQDIPGQLDVRQTIASAPAGRVPALRCEIAAAGSRPQSLSSGALLTEVRPSQRCRAGTVKTRNMQSVGAAAIRCEKRIAEVGTISLTGAQRNLSEAVQPSGVTETASASAAGAQLPQGLYAATTNRRSAREGAARRPLKAAER